MREYYGFAFYAASTMLYVVYLIWAFLPDWILHSCGIYYYPSRYWAIAIPTLFMVAPPTIFAAFAAHNMMQVPDLCDPRAMRDDDPASLLSDQQIKEQLHQLRTTEKIPDIRDLPLHYVNERLFPIKSKLYTKQEDIEGGKK